MFDFCASHRLPYARVDPIDDAAARLLLTSCFARPRHTETVVLLLDHQRRGVAVVNVTDIEVDRRDSIYDVVDFVEASACGMPEVSAVVLGSTRPHGTDALADSLGDIDRWRDIDDQLACAGLELIEWYVFGRTVSRPRVDLGAPSRWAP